VRFRTRSQEVEAVQLTEETDDTAADYWADMAADAKAMRDGR